MKTSGKSWAKYIDKSIKAKKSGWRTSSETGERYYEDRPNHSDVSRKDKYEDGGIMAKGGSMGNSGEGAGARDLDELSLNELKFQLKHSTKPNEKERIALLKKLIAQKENSKMAKGGKTKKAKEPMVVRSYFEDEAIDYGKGGAIYKGDKVRIKDSNKTMVVKSIAKGKKGYVEFSGSEGTFLKGDLEKFEDGGMVGGDWCYSIGGL
jgi:hypothetical protein